MKTSLRCLINSTLAVLLVGACSKQSDKANEEQVKPLPQAAVLPPLEKEVLVQNSSDGSDSVIIDSAYIVATLNNYAGYDRPIFASKTFLQANPQPPYISQNFSGQTFFVSPLILVDLDELKTAFATRRQVIESGNPALKEVVFEIHLMDLDYRKAAADRLNALAPGANVTADSISVIPYRSIQVYTRMSDSQDAPKVLLTAYPKLTADDLKYSKAPALLASRPNAVDVTVRGDDEYLDTIISKPQRIGGEFYISGFSVKQNILTYSIANLVTQGYHRFLTGEADFKHLNETTSSSGGGMLSIIPMTVGMGSASSTAKITHESRVTRNQIRAVVGKAAATIRGSMWVEIQSNDEIFKQLQERMVSALSEHATAASVNLKKVEDRWAIEDAALADDIKPDAIAEINVAIKNSGGIKASASMQGKGTSASSESTYTDSNDVTWVNNGAVMVPKSIKLYNFSKASFNEFTSSSFSYTQATNQTNRFVQGVTRRWRELRNQNVEVTEPVRRQILLFWTSGSLHLVDRARSVAHFGDGNLGGAGRRLETYLSYCDPFNPGDYLRAEYPKNIAPKHDPRACIRDEKILDDPAPKGLPPVHVDWPVYLDDEQWFYGAVTRNERVTRNAPVNVVIYKGP